MAIFEANHPLETVGDWARQDAALTHPNPVCLHANALFTMAIAHAIASGCEAEKLYQNIKQWAADLAVDPVLMDAIHEAAEAPPADYVQQQGWVLIAFRNALWQLLNAPNFEAGAVDTVMRGNDTDTNAAICGALLGAVYGLDAILVQWVRPGPELPPQGRTSRRQPPATRMLLAGGCFGTGKSISSGRIACIDYGVGYEKWVALSLA